MNKNRFLRGDLRAWGLPLAIIVGTAILIAGVMIPLIYDAWYFLWLISPPLGMALVFPSAIAVAGDILLVEAYRKQFETKNDKQS